MTKFKMQSFLHFPKAGDIKFIEFACYLFYRWSGQAIGQGNFQCRSVLLFSIVVGQGPTVLAVGVDGVVSFFSPSFYVD